ncbi:putative hscarg dehydrogenase [Thozetella sp. PMI_491]|nr:putative hscarg dehydrogenase [Thozetella sp. PMI_491]
MSKTIVITGVTGVQGSSIAETFLQLPGWRVRGITRNPSSDAAKAQEAKGVEIFKGDFTDVQSLIPAFIGAHVIFSNTDFWVPFREAIFSGNLPAGRTPNQYGYDCEVTQGVNIAEAAASPEVIKTLERFIVSSLSEARKWSKGKYTEIYHNDCKGEMMKIIRERFPEVGARMSAVMIGHYVTNWKAFPSMAPQKQPDGSFLILRPISEKAVIPFIVTHRDTGAFVKALVDLPPGKELLGVSENMTFPEWIALWGKILGVKTGYKQVSRAEFFEGVPAPMAQELGDTYDFMEEFGFTGGDPDVLLPEQLDFKIPLTSMEEYIKSEDWSSVLNS